MSVSGQQYASIDDLTQAGLPAGALASLDKRTWNQALIRASSLAASRIGCKYTLPLAAPFDPALVDAVCQIAAWRLLCLRGFNPSNPGDQVVRQGYLDADEWLTKVANGQAQIQVVTQATPESLQPDTYSNTPRGYGDLAGSGQVVNYVPGAENWGT
jgi:phage gp36-like protein